MNETQTVMFISNVQKMLTDIEEAYLKEKDPIAKCELAKGYFEIGRYLYDEDVLPSEDLGESISRHLS